MKVRICERLGSGSNRSSASRIRHPSPLLGREFLPAPLDSVIALLVLEPGEALHKRLLPLRALLEVKGLLAEHDGVALLPPMLAEDAAFLLVALFGLLLRLHAQQLPPERVLFFGAEVGRLEGCAESCEFGGAVGF